MLINSTYYCAFEFIENLCKEGIKGKDKNGGAIMIKETKRYRNEYNIDGGCYIVERSFGTVKTINDLIKEIITNKELASNSCCKREPMI